MSESETHQEIKYGDLIYIEFTYKKNTFRNILTAGEFNLKGKFDVEIKILDLENDHIYLKNFENNLFIIFPKMKDEFMNNKTFLTNGLTFLKEKIKTSKALSYDNEFKNNITKVIKAFQETKENVYSENEKFMEYIGKPIKYEDDFILIHYTTQSFVKRNEKANNKSSALILTSDYTDECIFFFAQSSSFNFNLKNVFPNQNVFICKREKNIWSNSHFLIVKPVYLDKTKNEINNLLSSNNIGKNNNESAKNKYMEKTEEINFIIDFHEGQGQAFQIKVCSNYIDPSSSNLTFATPVWLTVQSIDRYLNITMLTKTDNLNNEFETVNPNIDNNTNKNDNNTNQKGINNLNDNNNISGKKTISTNRLTLPINALANNINNSPFNKNDINNLINYEHRKTKSNITNYPISSNLNHLNSNQTINYKAKSCLPLNSYKISFDSTDKEKSINNINGLFFIEQYDKEKDDIKTIKDDYLKKKEKLKMELKLPSYVEFLKKIRFRHITSKKYLGFQEISNDDMKRNYNKDTNNESNKKDSKGKTYGRLILMDDPNEDCDWMLLESYKVMDSEGYFEAKDEGMDKRMLAKEEQEVEEESEEIDDYDENEEKKVPSEKSEKSENQSYIDENKKSQEVIHKIKNNEILRIFHIKTQKFLCFDEVNNKIGEKNRTKTLLADDLYTPKIDKKIYVHNLTLSTVPYDSDLVRLIPYDINQSLEISIVLYFKNQLNEQIDFLLKNDYKKILGIETIRSLRGTIEVNTNTINNNIKDENNINTKKDTNNININNNARSSDYKSKKNMITDLKAVKDKTLQINESFRNIIDYCLNNFSRKYDINISPGKALFYRQQFLYDQGLLKKTFKYLEYTKNLNEIYEEYNEMNKKRFEEEEEAEKLRSTLTLKKRKTLKSINNKKNVLDLNNNPDFIILETFKNISESVKLCFEFIYSMCKNNHNNKKIAFNHKAIFLYYFLEYEKASKCFMDLLKENENIMNLINNQENKNNENVLESETDEDNIIDKILLYLNKSKNYERKNLSLLSKFLIIGDSGITSNQQYIFEELFYHGKDRFLIKIKPLYNDIEFRIVYKDENNNYIEYNLIEFCNNRVLAEKGIIKYLAEQLNLYANLCYGRNYVCIEKIRKIFPLDHLIYHISKVDLNQEVLAGLINILNYVYIDIEPHIMNAYPSLIKRVTHSLRIERIEKEKIKTYIPLNKLNLILCISLFLLNNIKYGTVLVNTANINMIYNIIKFHLYENVVYSPLNINEVINNNLDQRLHNLKDEVKSHIIHGEELLINKKSENNLNKKEMDNKNNEMIDDISDLIPNNEEEHKLINENTTNQNSGFTNINNFYNRYGYKFIDFNFESPNGEEYLLFVLDRINDFFLNSLIIANIDNNTEDKNIISQNFKSVSSNDILTQSNINYLMEALIDIKNILTKENNELNNNYILIMKQIEKVISFILDIKVEDMSNYILENLLKINYQLIDKGIKKKDEIGKEFEFLYKVVKQKLFELPNIRDILMDDEFYYYQLFNKINFYDNIPKFFSNSKNSKDNEILSALLKRDKTQEQNKRLLNNSLFSEESSLIEMNYGKYKDIQDLTNNYFSSNSNYINEGYHDSEYYYNLNMPNLDINFENFFMNSVIFKNLIELIIRILEMNVNAKMTKILLRIFKRLISQRKELFDCLKNVLILYKNEDLQKYYLCNISIKELSLLAEKTEKWMTEDHVPINIRNMDQPDNVNIEEIEDDQREFFLVYSTIYKYLSMINDFETKSYYEENEVKLIQKIFYSFQMEKILSSLVKEIIQEYPSGENNENNTLELEKSIKNTRKSNYLIKSINSKYYAKTFLENEKKKKSKFNETLQQKKEKEIIYKYALEKLLKIIFKLFLALVHNTSPNLNEEIIEVVDFSKEYKYLLNFGFLQLIIELSSNEKFVLVNIKYLVDLINEQLSLDYIKEIKIHFFDYYIYFQRDNYNDSTLRQNNLIHTMKNYQKILKKYSFLLKLMKNVTTKNNDEKYIGSLLEKYVEITSNFDLFRLPVNQYVSYRQSMAFNESGMINLKKTILPIKTNKTLTIDSNNCNNVDPNCKIEYYRLSFVYYLIKITYRLMKKNQQLKQYVSSLISLNRLINFIFDLNPPFKKEQITEIISSKQYKESKIFLKIQYYFKVKYIGCILIFALLKNTKEKNKYLEKSIETYYSKLNEDLDYAFYFNHQIEKFAKFTQKMSNYYKVYERYKRHMYKYFFKGIFQLLCFLLSKFSEKLFKNYSDYQTSTIHYIKINKKWYRLYNELKNESNEKSFQKLLNYIEHKKKEFQMVFKIEKSSLDEQNYSHIHSEGRIINYIKTLKQELVGPEENKLSSLYNNPDRHDEILFEITINFVNDLINEIDNNEVVEKCIRREKKIMARHLKTKINFHYLLQKYIEYESQNETENIHPGNEAEIHLVNVFLKFIQENADNKKYFTVIKELIELMVYLVLVTPEIIKREKKVEKNNLNYFDQKVIEFKENFFYQCQKSYLNNGAIETFLRIASQRGKYFHQNTFNMIIYFFKTILEGGNTDVQKKFMQLFQLLSNCDNFFMSIYQTFNKDIFYTLNSNPFIEEIKKDNQNLEIVTDKLRFLQLLTENHNLYLQNYLREQTNNRISYNFLNILIEYLSMLLTKLGNIKDKYKSVPRYYSELYYKRLLYLLDTICEFLQGPCKKNQEYLINTKVIELFNKIMEETIITSLNEDEDKKEINDENINQNTVFSLNNKINNPDSFFSENITYSRGEGSDEELNYNDNADDSTELKKILIFSPLSNYEKSMLLFKISLVLLSIIEGRQTKDSVIRKVLRDINYKSVFEKCGEIYKKLNDEMIFFLSNEDNTKDIEDLDDKIVAEAGFNLYFLMETLVSMENEETELKVNSSLLLEGNKYDRIQKEKIQEIFNSTIPKAIEFYRENSLSIEILKDKEVFKVYCPRLHFFDAYDEKMQKDFDDNADRESTQSKLTYLINRKEQIYMTLKQINVLEQKYGRFGPLKYLLIYQNKVKMVGFILVVLMNVLMFVGYNAEKDKDQKNVIHNVKIFQLSEASSTALLHILGVIILIFDIIIFLEFITKDAVLIYKTLHRKFLKKSYEKKISYISDLEIHRVYSFLKSSGYSLYCHKLMIYLKLLFNGHVLYSICYMIFAILGLFVHHFFFSFHLIELIKSQPILKSVFLAFYEPLADFVFTLIFFFILIYFYSLLIFYRYYDLMPDYSCDSPLICMMYIYSNTFTSGGNLGNFIDTKEESLNVSGDMERYLLDISYTVIMVYIVWQMVSGLILDAFDNLRRDREEIEEDMETNCFICGLNREKIEKYYLGKEGFEKHLQDHSVENYLFYMLYLEEKDPNEYSGFESYVKENIDKESIIWFPIGRSLKIEEWESKHKA